MATVTVRSLSAPQPVDYDPFGNAPTPDYSGAISSVESGGRYDLLGPVTRTGDRAHGKYQIMGQNIGPWSKEVFGVELTPQQFLASPQAQDAIFQHKFNQYVQKYGPQGAARAWFAGEKGMNYPNRRDQLGTSVSEYERRFNKALPSTAMPYAAPTDISSAQASAPQPVDYDPFQGATSAATEVKPLAKTPSVSTTEALARGAATGATANFYDELRGLGEAGGLQPNEPLGLGSVLTGAYRLLVSGDPKAQAAYDAAVQRERGITQTTEAAAPIASTVGNIGGAVGGAVLAAPLAGAARITKAGQAFSQLPSALRYTGLGAASGALYGAGAATEGNRLAGTGEGAGIGAAVGAVLPPVLKGVARTVSGVRGAFSPRANVAADLSRAIRRDMETPSALQQRATQIAADRGGIATLADVGGENVRGLVERVAQTPGAGRTQVVPFLQGRQKMQAMRIADDLKELLGTDKQAYSTIKQVMEERAIAADPLYKSAYKVDVANNPEVTTAFLKEITTGWGKSIINSKEVKRTLQTEYGISKVTTQDELLRNLMPIIDSWKKAADDIIGKNLGTNKARVIKQMRDRVINVVDKVNPDYAAARNAWAGPSQYLEAIQYGRDILGRKTSSQEFSAAFAAMGDSEKEAVRIGAISSIIGKIRSDPAKLADFTKYIRSPEMRDKIAAMMPTPEAAEAWMRRLDFEILGSELTGRALGNSATARRLAERQDAENLVGDLVFEAMMGTPMQGILRRIIGAGPRWLRDTLRSRSDALLADILTNPTRMQNLPNILNRVSRTANPPSALTNAAAITGTTAGLTR